MRPQISKSDIQVLEEWLASSITSRAVTDILYVSPDWDDTDRS